MLALSFARSAAPTASALRFSILPLIDNIMHLAFKYGVEGDVCRDFFVDKAFDLKRSEISLQAFLNSKYVESELQQQAQAARGQQHF